MNSQFCTILPPPGPSIWQRGPDEQLGVTLHQLMAFGLVVLVGVVLAVLGTFSFGGEGGVASFWPAAALQVVAGIWFGFWGALASSIFPMLANFLAGQAALQYVPANFVQSALAGLWFRIFKLDPCLRRKRDLLSALVVGCIGAQLLGALLGMVDFSTRQQGAGTPVPLARAFDLGIRWALGNGAPALVLVPLCMWTLSPLLVGSPFFSVTFFRARRQKLAWRWRFSDQPVLIKVLFGLFVVGILPLLTIAVLSSVDTYQKAKAKTQEEAEQFVSVLANYFNEEVERRWAILSSTAATISRLNLDTAKAKDLVDAVSAHGQAFDRLELVPANDLGRYLDEYPLARVDFDAGRITLTPPPPRTNGPSYMVKAVSDPNGHAALVGAITWTLPSALTGLTTWQANMSRWALIDAQGVPRYTSALPPADLDAIYDRQFAGPAGWFETTTAEGPRLVAYHRWSATGWYVVVVAKFRENVAYMLSQHPDPVGALVTVAVFASFIMGGALACRLAQPVNQLAQLVRSAGPAPVGLKVPVTGADELGQLAAAFNEMSENLGSYIDQLRRATAEKERLASELAVAKRVQQSALPRQPFAIDGYELAALSLPAREVGGDFYDYFYLDRHRAALMIGDACGKGLGAAMFMAECKSVARAFANTTTPPDRTLARANAAILADSAPPGWFITMFYAILDPETGEFVYSNGGHNPPLLLEKKSDEVHMLRIGGRALGVHDDDAYSAEQVRLEPGDLIMMYTDGVTEVFGRNAELFSIERLMRTLLEHRELAPAELNRRVVEATTVFAAGRERQDDLTLLTIRRSG